MTSPDHQSAERRNLAVRWRRFRRETQSGGVLYTMHYLLSFLLPPRHFRFGSVHIIALELDSIEAPTEGAACIRSATPQDIEALIASPDSQSDAVRREFGRGSDVWVVEREGKLVAYDICGAQTRALADFIRLEAPERDTWAIGVWVAPEARGQGLAVQLRRHAAQEFRSRGVVHLWGTISATNKRSIRAFEKIGARFTGRIDYVWLYGFGFVRFDGRLRVGRWTKHRPLALPVSLNDRQRSDLDGAL